MRSTIPGFDRSERSRRKDKFERGTRVRVAAPGKCTHGAVGTVCLQPTAAGLSIYADRERKTLHVLFDRMDATVTVPVRQLRPVRARRRKRTRR